jgi:hypothetical protein
VGGPGAKGVKKRVVEMGKKKKKVLWKERKMLKKQTEYKKIKTKKKVKTRK